MSKRKLPRCRVRVETFSDGSVRYLPEAEHRVWPFPSKWHCHQNMWTGDSTEPEYSKLWAEQLIEKFLARLQKHYDHLDLQESKKISYYNHPEV